MANGGNQSSFINSVTKIDDLGRVHIPKEIRKKLGIKEGDILEITATDNLIVIEKCESEGEDNDYICN